MGKIESSPCSLDRIICMFIFFFDVKEKTNQKKKPPPSIIAIPGIRLPERIFYCDYNGGNFNFRRLVTFLFFNILDLFTEKKNKEILVFSKNVCYNTIAKQIEYRKSEEIFDSTRE